MTPLPPGNLEEQRKHLINVIGRYKPQGSLRNEVTLIFDGQAGIINFDPLPLSGIKIVYSKGESADDKIKKIVSLAANKKNIKVVTDDRDIQYAVKALGAQVVPVAQFLKKMQPVQQKNATTNKNRKHKEISKNMPKNIEMQITSELKDIWVNKDK